MRLDPPIIQGQVAPQDIPRPLLFALETSGKGPSKGIFYNSHGFYIRGNAVNKEGFIRNKEKYTVILFLAKNYFAR